MKQAIKAAAAALVRAWRRIANPNAGPVRGDPK